MSYNVYDKIFRNGFVPVLENLAPKTAAAVAEAMKVGGLDLVDISFAGKQAEAAVKEIAAKCPDVVVGGFHLMAPGDGWDEPEELIRAVGKELFRRSHTRYITGHCTGHGPYAILKEMLGDKLDYMSAGTVFEL